MKIINIETSSKSYPLYLGSGILAQLPNVIQKINASVTKVMIITDGNVQKHYGSEVQSILEKSFKTCAYILPSGEKAKSFDQFYQCHTYALEQGLDRHSLIIAMGGGVVGDLAGFVAATFMRGIPFIQVPTTLLAHDSAVGGKVAINHDLGKNMIGAFYQPEAVFYDIQLLTTLPEKELLSGFAEVIKHALISELSFYEWLKEHIHDISDLNGDSLSYAIEKGILVKAQIVFEDETEKGVRAFLNLGHTLGHAIESALGYGGITHGEAVIIGTVFALKLSKQLYKLDFNLSEFESWLSKLGYATTVPEFLEPEVLLDKMKKDKKNKGNHIRMVLLKEIGLPEVTEVDETLLLTLLQQAVSSHKVK